MWDRTALGVRVTAWVGSWRTDLEKPGGDPADFSWLPPRYPWLWKYREDCSPVPCTRQGLRERCGGRKEPATQDVGGSPSVPRITSCPPSPLLSPCPPPGAPAPAGRRPGSCPASSLLCSVLPLGWLEGASLNVAPPPTCRVHFVTSSSWWPRCLSPSPMPLPSDCAGNPQGCPHPLSDATSAGKPSLPSQPSGTPTLCSARPTLPPPNICCKGLSTGLWSACPRGLECLL